MAFLILHGWMGNWMGDERHWQTWLAGRLIDRGAVVHYPVLPDFERPRLTDWLAVLDRELDELPDDLVVVCHSLAAILWLHHAGRRSGRRVTRAVLVAPPSPTTGVEELAPWFPVPLDREGVIEAAAETLLVCSDDDPFCPEGAGTLYGTPLGIEPVVIEGGGHLNPEAGFGEWPEIEQLVVAPVA
jgi:predicted alpha/beta hydrolase family esterase